MAPTTSASSQALGGTSCSAALTSGRVARTDRICASGGLDGFAMAEKGLERVAAWGMNPDSIGLASAI